MCSSDLGALKRIQQELDILKPKKQDNEDELGVTMEEMIGMTGLAPDVFHDVYLSWVESELPSHHSSAFDLIFSR